MKKVKSKRTEYKGIYIRGDNGKVQVDTTYKRKRLCQQFSDGEKKTIREAYKWLQERKREIDTGKHVNNRKTLEEVYLFLDEERKGKGLKKEQSSRVTDKIFKNHIATLLNTDLYIDSFTMEDIRDFQSKILKSELKPNTKGNVIALLKQIFKTAIRQGWYKEQDPTTILDKPRVAIQKPIIFTEDIQEKLFSQAEKEFNRNPNLLGFLALGIYGGLRRGEIFGLQWKDIDFEKHEIYIDRQYNATLNDFTDPKTEGSKDNIPMCPELQDVLTRIHNGVKGLAVYKDTDCVITRRRGRYTGEPLAPNGAYYLMSRIIKRCGLSVETGSHILRKTCNTHMIKKYGYEAGRVMMRHTDKKDITWTVYTNRNVIVESVKKQMWEKKAA